MENVTCCSYKLLKKQLVTVTALLVTSYYPSLKILNSAEVEPLDCAKVRRYLILVTVKAVTVVYFARIIHEGGFTKDDNKTYIPIVRSNTIQALVAIIRAMATLRIDFADIHREVFGLSVLHLPCRVCSSDSPRMFPFG